MDGLKIEIPGVEVVGTFPVKAFFDTLAILESKKCEKYGVQATLTVTPPAQDERTARPASSRGTPEQRACA